MDVAACGIKLEGCALEQAREVVPDEVVEVIDDVTKCTVATNRCIAEASSPSGITECTERQVKCVADSLGVPVPEVPLSCDLISAMTLSRSR